jgi:hypothetical protein
LRTGDTASGSRLRSDSMNRARGAEPVAAAAKADPMDDPMANLMANPMATAATRTKTKEKLFFIISLCRSRKYPNQRPLHRAKCTADC